LLKRSQSVPLSAFQEEATSAGKGENMSKFNSVYDQSAFFSPPAGISSVAGSLLPTT
jgi:hypothetical protein